MQNVMQEFFIMQNNAIKLLFTTLYREVLFGVGVCKSPIPSSNLGGASKGNPSKATLSANQLFFIKSIFW